MKLISREDTLKDYVAPFTLFEVVRGGFGILDSNRMFLHMADQDPIMANIQVEAYNLLWEQNNIPPIYVPDWSKAPVDARYHSIDEDGQCTWWANKPICSSCDWYSQSGYFYHDRIIEPHDKWEKAWWIYTLSEKPV